MSFFFFLLRVFFPRAFISTFNFENMEPSILFPRFGEFIIIDGTKTNIHIQHATRIQNIQFNGTFAMHIIHNSGNMYSCWCWCWFDVSMPIHAHPSLFFAVFFFASSFSSLSVENGFETIDNSGIRLCANSEQKMDRWFFKCLLNR